jgi:hypothetical protein
VIGRKGGEFSLSLINTNEEVSSLSLTLGEHIENLGTHWALEGNIEGTKKK